MFFALIVSLMVMTAVFGGWLVLALYREESLNWKVHAGHAMFGVLTAGGVFGWLLNNTAYRTALSEELAASGVVLTVLIGFLLGLQRIAQTGISTIILFLHVLAALIGFGGFFWVVFY